MRSLPFARRPRENVLRVGGRVPSFSRVWLPVGSLSLFALFAAGCGRRATEADCQLIVDKSVEVQLRQMSTTDAPAIRKREVQVREELQGEIKSCEGRRVTDKTMSCVQASSTTQELDQCLR
jgi:hypothetical protein